MRHIVDRTYVRIVETCIIGGLILMVGLTFASTLIRSLGYGGIYWSEELTRYISIWVTMLAAGHGLRYGIHLSVDIFTASIPAGAARLLAFISHILVLVFASVLVIYGTRLSIANIGQYSTSLSISMAYVQSAIPVGGVLIIYETLRAVSFELHGLPDPTAGVARSMKSEELEVE